MDLNDGFWDLQPLLDFIRTSLYFGLQLGFWASNWPVKKYLEVEEKKNWMNGQMLEDIKDDDSQFSFQLNLSIMFS